METSKTNEVRWALDNGNDYVFTADQMTLVANVTSAKITPQGKLIVETVTSNATNSIILATPVAFKVLTCTTYTSTTVGSAVAIVSNSTDAISDSIPIDTANEVYYGVVIDETYASFAEGDDDFKIVIDKTAVTGKIICDIQLL